MRLPSRVTAVSIPLAVLLGACGSNTTSSTKASGPRPTSSTAAQSPQTSSPAVSNGGVDPNAPEVVAPGDIPDNQVFVPFRSPDGSYTIKVPEGWTKTGTGNVTFSDHYNSITSAVVDTAMPLSADAVKATGLADIASDPTFRLLSISAVHRTAGAGFVARYEIGSAPNPVTGKKALLAVERYFFEHAGKRLTLTLSGAKGADNVDPWKTVSDSLVWN